MDITFLEKMKVKISMKNYLKEAIEAFGEDMTMGAATPTTRNLFEVNEDLALLKPKKAELFHHIVANVVFVAR